jgi:ABC-type polysaccharide/polyol phosphate transport system ATPase subunit
MTDTPTKGHISARALTKRFRVQKEKSASIKEILTKGPFRRGEAFDVCALDAIDLVVEPGEALGIIGSNGSGKSTLLKLIAGITEPTSGAIQVGGRVAALLELGVGFHPELTGMENIHLSASILGLTRAQVDERLDEIIDFAGVRRFIHTPVKHYSTGMYVRLGFSLATHVDPDIVLLDEVISVGDADFRAKSLDRIRAMRRAGKTIVLVTHALDDAETTCDKILWLDKGKAAAYGPTADVLRMYQAEMYASLGRTERVDLDWDLASMSWTVRMGSGEAIIERVEMLDSSGRETRHFRTGDAMRVRVHYRVEKHVPDLVALLGINVAAGVGCGIVDSTAQATLRDVSGRGVFECVFDPLLLGAEDYRLTVALSPAERLRDVYDLHLRLYPFEVRPGDAPRRFKPVLELPCVVEWRGFKG